MKLPKNMTMPELIALPVMRERGKLRGMADTSALGGAFKDESGHVWGTLRLGSGWVRFPAYLSVLS